MFVEKYPFTEIGDYLNNTVAPKIFHQLDYNLDTNKTILHMAMWPCHFDTQDFFTQFTDEHIKLLQDGRAILYIEFMNDPHQKQEQVDTIRKLCERRNIDCNLIIMLVSNPNLTDPDIKFICEYDAGTQLGVMFGMMGFSFRSEMFIGHEGENSLNNLHRRLGAVRHHDILLTSYEEQLQHKKQYGAKDFMLLQRSIRPHRNIIYNKLVGAGLWENNNCSYIHKGIFLPDEETKLRQIQVTRDFEKIWYRRPYVLDSWVVCVSESHDYSHFPWISEKWYQAMINSMPMIFLGPQNSLDLFRDFGFKTFDKYFNECYDKQSSFEDRMNEVVTLLRNIGSIDDKLSWYESMRDVIEHNYNHAIDFYTPSPNKYLDNFVKLFNNALRSIG